MSSCKLSSTSCKSAGDIPSKSSLCLCSVSFLLGLKSREIKILRKDKLHLNSSGEHKKQNKQASLQARENSSRRQARENWQPVPSAGKLATGVKRGKTGDHRKQSKPIKAEKNNYKKTKKKQKVSVGQKSDSVNQRITSYPQVSTIKLNELSTVY